MPWTTNETRTGRLFCSKIGPGSALIYIGDHLGDVQDQELHAILDRFRKENRALLVSIDLFDLIGRAISPRSIVEWRSTKSTKISRKI